MKRTPLFTLFLALFALSSQLTAEIQQAAVARLVKATGDYLVIGEDGEARTLDDSRQLYEGETIAMGEDATATVVFSTGSIATLKPETVVYVERLRQETVSEATEQDETREPSPSDIELRLYHGNIISDVKKLREQSAYEVHGPVGTAGVRGTVFSVIVANPAFSPIYVGGSSSSPQTTPISSALYATSPSSFPYPVTPGLPRTVDPLLPTLQQQPVTMDISTLTGTVTVQPTLDFSAPTSGQTQGGEQPVGAAQRTSLSNVLGSVNQSGQETSVTPPTPSDQQTLAALVNQVRNARNAANEAMQEMGQQSSGTPTSTLDPLPTQQEIRDRIQQLTDEIREQTQQGDQGTEAQTPEDEEGTTDEEIQTPDLPVVLPGEDATEGDLVN
ncbi:MAG: Uncharacterized protein E1N59_1872 [Puniceicoccaceae bacterium 5H]|nr:MAG: Uncharacterized protein E1N59_1872 [Puniceicoccaceae bacterium 5H]